MKYLSILVLVFLQINLASHCRAQTWLERVQLQAGADSQGDIDFISSMNSSQPLILPWQGAVSANFANDTHAAISGPVEFTNGVLAFDFGPGVLSTDSPGGGAFVRASFNIRLGNSPTDPLVLFLNANFGQQVIFPGSSTPGFILHSAIKIVSDSPPGTTVYQRFRTEAFDLATDGQHSSLSIPLSWNGTAPIEYNIHIVVQVGAICLNFCSDDAPIVTLPTITGTIGGYPNGPIIHTTGSSSFGTPQPGSGGFSPKFQLLPSQSDHLNMLVNHALGGSDLYLVVGNGTANIPMSPGLTLFVNTPVELYGPFTMFNVGAGNGGLLLAPYVDPSILPLGITVQAFCADAASPSGFSHTRGWDLTIE